MARIAATAISNAFQIRDSNRFNVMFPFQEGR